MHNKSAAPRSIDATQLLRQEQKEISFDQSNNVTMPVVEIRSSHKDSKKPTEEAPVAPEVVGQTKHVLVDEKNSSTNLQLQSMTSDSKLLANTTATHRR